MRICEGGRLWGIHSVMQDAFRQESEMVGVLEVGVQLVAYGGGGSVEGHAQ